MWSHILEILKERKAGSTFALYMKYGAVFALISLSILVVACGGSGTNTNIDNPPVTVTINLDNNGSPTPPLPNYSCNAWVTNTTPSVYANAIAVYAKYTHLDGSGNPVGIGGATAVANVLWPDGNISIVTEQTTGDGLAVFPVSIANRSADLNKIVLVTVQFSGGGAPNCTVGANQAAFFTLIIASPTVTGSPTAGATNPAGGGTATPTTTPKPTRTPKATKTPHH